jgi:limonene-1,2-epoxide hydrolase
MSERTPADVVQDFLRALEADDVDTAVGLLAPNAVWINVSLPAIRGRDRIERILRLSAGRIGFRVHFHEVAAQGSVVVTERDDALVFGPVEQRFWVWGRFEVENGLIAVWRDSFDWLDYIVGLLRGVAGAVVPALNRPWPSRRSG